MSMISVLGFQIVGSNYFQATGRAMQSIFLNMARQTVFLIPALLILPRYLGLRGVWTAQPVADVLTFLVTGIFIWKEIRNLNHKQRSLSMATAEGLSLGG